LFFPVSLSSKVLSAKGIKMLIDYARIYASGGRGGDGCHSFYRDAYNRKGTPDGGNGGDGGNVVFISDQNLQTLLDFKYNKHYRAGDGKHGSSNHKQGKRGETLIVRVPVGTIIRDSDTGLVIRDFTKPGEEVAVVQGGPGGKGNGTRREVSDGEFGEEKNLILELKYLADAGLIGLPNAGKSTLISNISKVHTKIAPYPFTTKEPRLGVVETEDDTFIAADMPGLIEGAHSGRGLGDKFLKHIERTYVLVHVVEMMPLDQSDPVENYKKIEKELKLYSKEVLAKPRVIVASKMDMDGAKDAFKKFKGKIKKRNIIPISAETREGLDELVSKIYREIKNVKEKMHQEGDDQDRD